MAEEKSYIIKLIRRFIAIASEDFSIKQVLLYGSYAKGTAREESDIDLAVILNHDNNENKFEITKKLYKTALKIDPKIEPRCFYADELEAAEPASILSEILKTGFVVS